MFGWFICSTNNNFQKEKEKEKGENKMAGPTRGHFDEARREAARQTTVDASIKAALKLIAQKFEAVKRNPDAVQELADELRESNDLMVGAIKENLGTSGAPGSLGGPSGGGGEADDELGPRGTKPSYTSTTSLTHPDSSHVSAVDEETAKRREEVPGLNVASIPLERLSPGVLTNEERKRVEDEKAAQLKKEMELQRATRPGTTPAGTPLPHAPAPTPAPANPYAPSSSGPAAGATPAKPSAP